MLWLLVSSLLAVLALDPAGPLPEVMVPTTAMRLQAGELLRMYKRSKRDPKVPYRSLLIVRSNNTVTLRTLLHAARFDLSESQRSDLNDAIANFDLRTFEKTRRKSKKPPSEEGEVDYFLSFRRGGKVLSWSNTQFDWPRPDPIFDCLEVYEYLARPPEPTP